MRTLSANLPRMPAPSTTLFNIHSLRRYDGPGWFLGTGFLAGLLCFAVWAHGRQDDGRHALQARGNGVVGMETPDDASKGVLGDITGKMHPGADSGLAGGDFFDSAQSDDQANGPVVANTLAPDQDFDQDYDQTADSMAVAPEVGAPPNAEGALTDSLLGPPPPEAAQAAAPTDAAPDAPNAPGDASLRTWFVEVEVAPGVVQMLQLNAESPEHALAILRDFRGNPRVLRGPSPEPLP
jgi:hypothetical protein